MTQWNLPKDALPATTSLRQMRGLGVFEGDFQLHGPVRNNETALDARHETMTLGFPIFALIVYRLGQEILNLQSGFRFPVGAPL